MYAVVITDEGGVQRRLDFSKPEMTVGRVQGNDIVLAKRNVSKQHARLSLEDEKAVVVDLNSTNGTWVNGRKITAPHPLKSGDKIYIADFILTLEPGHGSRSTSAVPGAVSEPPPLPSTSPAHSSVPTRSSVSVKSAIPEVHSLPIDTSIPAGGRHRPPRDAGKTSLPPRIERRPTDEAKPIGAGPTDDPVGELLDRLSERIDIEDLHPNSMKEQDRWSAARAAIAETFLAMQNDGSVNADIDMRDVAHTALHEAIGLGALDDVLSNPSVKMVVVHGPDRVLLDTGEGLRPTALSFSSHRALRVVAGRLAAQAGRTLAQGGVLHGRLSFGPRITILQAPFVANGPVIEIKTGRTVSLDALAEEGWMHGEAAAYLRRAVAESRNIIVVGPEDEGVTTLISAMANELPEAESTVVIEAVPDLEVDRKKMITLSALDAGISMTEAIAHGTRLSADRLVISDLSPEDCLPALRALSGRPPGHLLGVHGAPTGGAIEGLLLAASSNGVDRTFVAQLIGSTVDAVVAVERGAEGSRVAAILEVRGHEAADVSYESVPF